MKTSRDPADFVAHIVRLHARGIICPSEMWMQMAEHLNPENATTVLDALPEERRSELLSVFVERPPAAYIEQPTREAFSPALRNVCVQVVNWCQCRIDPQHLPTEPDGMIHVRVENGAVVEDRQGAE